MGLGKYIIDKTVETVAEKAVTTAAKAAVGVGIGAAGTAIAATGIAAEVAGKAVVKTAKGLSKASSVVSEKTNEIKEKGYEHSRQKMASTKKTTYLEIHKFYDEGSHNYEVFDKHGTRIFYVDSYYEKKNPDLVLFNASDKIIGAVKRKAHLGSPVFEISVDGSPYGIVSGKPNLIKDNYSVKFKDWEITSNLTSNKYLITDAVNNKIAIIERQSYTSGDLYAMNVFYAKDMHLCVLLTVAIDSCQEKGQ